LGRILPGRLEEIAGAAVLRAVFFEWETVKGGQKPDPFKKTKLPGNPTLSQERSPFEIDLFFLIYR
jgi:hypothetical protein